MEYIITKRPFYLTTKTYIEDVSKVLAKGKHLAIPIVEDHKIKGILHLCSCLLY